jgi:uncharacterized membrane protein HdeD (DUF308 family)
LALRGLCGIIFGVLAFIAPGAAISGIAIVFGAYALVTGLFAIGLAIMARRSHERWSAILLEGVVGVLAGVLVLFSPPLAVLAFVMVVAVWSLLTGGAQIAAAIRLRKMIANEWLFALAGFASIALGVALLLAPVAGAIVLAWWIGAYAFLFGILQVALAFKLRSWDRREHITPGTTYRAA